MKLLIFLVGVNIILTVFLLTECISIRQALESVRTHQDSIQILTSRLYGTPGNAEYVLNRKPKLKEKGDA